jgi:hypothetical protein
MTSSAASMAGPGPKQNDAQSARYAWSVGSRLAARYCAGPRCRSVARRRHRGRRSGRLFWRVPDRHFWDAHHAHGGKRPDASVVVPRCETLPSTEPS